MGLLRRHWPFAIALAGAAGVRVLVMLAFRPVIWFGGDSASYLATGLRLTPDPSRVGGYGFMLWVLRPLHSFVVVAAVQHAMGLAIGVLIYLLARRYGVAGWVATLATVPVLFDAYELQLEQDVLPDVAFAFLVMVALYLLLSPSWSGRRLAGVAVAGFALGLSAILWPVGLALLLVLVVFLIVSVILKRSGWLAVAAALGCGVVPVVGYAAWFDAHQHEFSLTRSSGVFLWSRTMSFADCAAIKPPSDERLLCPPPGPRVASSLYIWDGDSPLLRMPGGRFSARTNSLAMNFALRAIAAQPGGYAAAVAHDFGLSFYWDRPVHPDTGLVDRYEFASAATAWVPASMGTPGGGTVAGDQARYAGSPAATRAVQPFASWLVSYQKWVYLRGTMLGVILLGGLAMMIFRRRAASSLAALPWAFAATILLVPPLIADFDLRYLVPAVPVACLAAVLAFGKRTWTTSPAATGTTARPAWTAPAEDTRTTSLPSESTSTASPDST